MDLNYGSYTCRPFMPLVALTIGLSRDVTNTAFTFFIFRSLVFVKHFPSQSAGSGSLNHRILFIYRDCETVQSTHNVASCLIANHFDLNSRACAFYLAVSTLIECMLLLWYQSSWMINLVSGQLLQVKVPWDPLLFICFSPQLQHGDMSFASSWLLFPPLFYPFV